MSYVKINPMKKTGNKIDDGFGNMIDEEVPVAGFHINTLPEFMTPELEPFIVTAITPQAVYAGRDDTVCLKFTDEAEWLALGLD